MKHNKRFNRINLEKTQIVLGGFIIDGDFIPEKVMLYDTSRRPESKRNYKGKCDEDFLLWQIKGEIIPLTNKNDVFLVHRDAGDYVVVNTILGKNWYFNQATYDKNILKTNGTILVSKDFEISKNTEEGIEVVKDRVLFRFNPINGTIGSDVYSELQDRRIDTCNHYGKTYPAVGLSIDGIQFKELITKEVYEYMLFGQPNAYVLEDEAKEGCWGQISLRAIRK